ncbi:hypothetical protein MRX96_043683 [Rhipicephalus microplus]
MYASNATTDYKHAGSGVCAKRVAVALYKLCSSAEDRTVANLFDLGRSTVNTIYREFCDIVVEALEDQWVRMLAADEMTHHIREFYAVTGFPQAVRALDGCHFPVSPPKENAIDYYNYKGWRSETLLQASVAEQPSVAPSSSEERLDPVSMPRII